MRLPTRRRRVILTLLCLPAALTALLWIASHFWFIWYCSLPPGTLVRGATTQAMAIKVSILAGAVHYTDDTVHERDVVARMNTDRPLSPGSISLGTSYDGKTGMALSGLSLTWSPNSFRATRWRPQFYPGNWGFPLYVPFTLLLLPPVAFWTLSRPRNPGHCPTCNYNRAGLPHNAKCPECGTTS